VPNPPDARLLCARADRARLKGRTRRAVRLYQQALEADPDNMSIRRKLAPLHARRREFDDAWQCYQAAGDSLSARGFEAQAAGLIREAATLLPHNEAVWRHLAVLQHSLGRRADARNTLIEGRQHFKGRRNRAAAVALLADAHAIDPDDLELGIELARLLRKTKRPRKAQKVLHALLQRMPDERKRIRRELFWCCPTLASLEAWMRSLREPAGLQRSVR